MFVQKKCSDCVTYFFGQNKCLPRVLATIVNLPNTAWVQNIYIYLGTIANLAANQDTTLL